MIAIYIWLGAVTALLLFVWWRMRLGFRIIADYVEIQTQLNAQFRDAINGKADNEPRRVKETEEKKEAD